jgi:adenosylcobinamide-GDP ribazoletransferase
VTRDFLQAIQFLTRLPLAKDMEYQSDQAGRSVSWYAPAGLIIGICLVLTAWAASLLLPPVVVAAVVLGIWVAITGALHLDGLGDCGDAWMGGHNVERMLEIMKDTNCGIGAIVAVVVVLLIKFSTLTVIISAGDWVLLLFAPVLARISLSLVIYYFPYRRTEGLGSSLQESLDFGTILISATLLAVLLCFVSLPGFIYGSIACVIACAMIYWFFIKKIQGTTGDIYGALVEVTEALVLISLIVL